jgi:hypothetical protein
LRRRGDLTTRIWLIGDRTCLKGLSRN